MNRYSESSIEDEDRSVFSCLDDFLEDVESALNYSTKCLKAASYFLKGAADPNGNLEQTINLMEESTEEISTLRQKLPSMINEAEDREIAQAVQDYVNGDL